MSILTHKAFLAAAAPTLRFGSSAPAAADHASSSDAQESQTRPIQLVYVDRTGSPAIKARYRASLLSRSSGWVSSRIVIPVSSSAV